MVTIEILTEIMPLGWEFSDGLTVIFYSVFGLILLEWVWIIIFICIILSVLMSVTQRIVIVVKQKS